MREFIDNELENEQNKHTSDSQLPIINLKVQNINLKALLDTGAELSLINEKILQQNKQNFDQQTIKISKIRLINATGKKFAESNRVINLNFTVQKQIFNGEFIIVPKLNFDIILGEDILSKLRAKIDLGERILQIKGSTVPIIISKLNKIKFNENYDKRVECYTMETPTYEINVKNKILNSPENFKIKCPPECNDLVFKILNNYISLINYEPRIAEGYVHKLNVDESKPFRCKSYPIPYNYRQLVNFEIQNMIQNNIIESAKTEYINPLVIVKKKDGTIRLCLDARTLNQITKAQFDSPHTVDTMISRIGKNTIFTKLDLKNSFWLIPLARESRKYTGFSVDGHIYQFKVVPFGLQSSSSALVRAMQSILDKYDNFCIHYIDDILIFSETIEIHINHLIIILDALDTAGLKLNIEKCEFYQSSVKYLGYKIGQEGISIGAERIQEIKEYPRPKNLKTLRGFLGVLNYYKKFIPKLSELEVPLIELLRKNIKWEWDDRRETAFQTLKQNFHQNLLLHSPDFTLPFIVRTDASNHVLAAELVQIQAGIETPICFISRILKPYETRYSVSEKEMASVVFAITKLKFYLTAAHFTLETDHSALCFLMKNRFANSRIYRWSLLLQEYSFTIKHRPGKQNVTADALTRNRQTDEEKTDTYTIALNLLSSTEEPYTERQIRESQEKLQNLRNLLDTRQTYRGYSIKDTYIIKTIGTQENYVVDAELTKTIIQDLHNRFGHPGTRKTWLIYRENFYAEKDLTITKQIIANCHECCLGKTKNHTNHNQIYSTVTTKPLEIIAIDYITNLIKTREGYKHILVITDNFSKFTKAYPTKRCNTKTTTAILNSYCKNIGKPTKILADNATYFNNQRFINYWQNKNVKIIFTSIRHPQGNPAERYIQEIIRFLRLATQEQHMNWSEHLRIVEEHMNNVPSTITKCAPITTMLGLNPSRPWDSRQTDDLETLREKVRTRIKINAEKYIKRQKKKLNKQINYQINDLVIIKRLRVSDFDKKICAKLMYPFEGPYLVQEKINDNTYQLRHINSELIRGKFNIELIFPYTPGATNVI